jgi:acylphosphatase
MVPKVPQATPKAKLLKKWITEDEVVVFRLEKDGEDFALVAKNTQDGIAVTLATDSSELEEMIEILMKAQVLLRRVEGIPDDEEEEDPGDEDESDDEDDEDLDEDEDDEDDE